MDQTPAPTCSGRQTLLTLTAPSPPTGALGASGLVGLESCQSWKGPRRPPSAAPSAAVWGNSLGQVPGPGPGPALPLPHPHHPLADTSPRLIRAPSLHEQLKLKPRACSQASSFAHVHSFPSSPLLIPVARAGLQRPSGCTPPLRFRERGLRLETEDMLGGGQCSPPSRATVPSDAPHTSAGTSERRTRPQGSELEPWPTGLRPET